MRLNLFLASSGAISRRQADRYIEEGRVQVNGMKARLGMNVEESDKVLLDDMEVKVAEKKEYVMYHKPAGVMCSMSDPKHDKTLRRVLPKSLHHLKPAGRLDVDTEGLLLLSNDGQWIQNLTHPKYEHGKLYEAVLKGQLKESDLGPFILGKLRLDGKPLAPIQIEIQKVHENRTWIRLVLTEGRKRQIRRMMEILGKPVIYLRRTAIGQLELASLPKASFRYLTETDVRNALLPVIFNPTLPEFVQQDSSDRDSHSTKPPRKKGLGGTPVGGRKRPTLGPKLEADTLQKKYARPASHRKHNKADDRPRGARRKPSGRSRSY